MATSEDFNDGHPTAGPGPSRMHRVPQHMEDHPFKHHATIRATEDWASERTEMLLQRESIHAILQSSGMEEEIWERIEACLKDLTRQMKELQTATDVLKVCLTVSIIYMTYNILLDVYASIIFLTED